MDLQTQNNMVG